MMNRIQRAILVLCSVAALVGGFLFVPWVKTYHARGVVRATAIGYAPIFLPPEVDDPASVVVDWRRIVMTLLALTLVAVAATLAAGRRNRSVNK